MKTKTSLRKLMKVFAADEDGVMMTEYVIMLTMLVVATIWLNKSADTLLFGADPFARTGQPQLRDDTIMPGADDAGDGLAGSRAANLMTQIASPGGTGAPTKKAYLSQVYIHLSRP